MTRRELHLFAGAVAGSDSSPAQGTVIGEPLGARAGIDVLAAGGNVADAIVSAALTAGVVALPSCGIGGYGGHMTLAFAETGKVTSIDFNSTAPMALREDSFTPDAAGRVPGLVNRKRQTAELARPAIRFARERFEVSEALNRKDGATR